MRVSIFKKCLSVTSFFEGSDSFSNVAGNYDNQILSLGCLCFTVKSGLAKKLFENVMAGHPNFLSSLSDEAVKFVIAIIKDDHSFLLSKQLSSRWLAMVKDLMGREEVVESQKALAYKTFFIPSLMQTERIKKEYPAIEFTELTTLFAFDILVQNGSFRKSIAQSKNLNSSYVAQYIRPNESLSDEQVALIKILQSRAMACPSTYRKDVLIRKLAIIKKAEKIVIHGKIFNFSKLVGEI